MPNVLYSATTLLAFRISQLYYRDIHYAWCSPVFDGREHSDLESGVPPTSSPYEIYLAFRQESERSDRHGPRILENRAGILRGAAVKRESGTISKDQEDEIAAIVHAADYRYFRPMIFVIPFASVQDRVQPVPVLQRASLLSSEVIIPHLPRHLFDIIRP
jgi:hypothetical protein